MDNDILTTEEAATALGVTARQVRRLIDSGALKAKQVGGGNRATYFIRREDIALVPERKVGRPRKAKAEVKKAKKKGKAEK